MSETSDPTRAFLVANFDAAFYRDKVARTKAALEDARAEIARLTAERDDQTAIVARIWAQLGSPSYQELAGRSIYDLIDALLAEQAWISKAMAFGTETDVLYNLEGALIDLDRLEADPICCATIRRVIKQLSPLRAAPIPAPVDREAIRAEAFEEAAEIADAMQSDSKPLTGVYWKNGCEDTAAAIRSAAKTEASR